MTNYTPGPWMVSRYLFQDKNQPSSLFGDYFYKEIYAEDGCVTVARTGKYDTEDSPMEANAQLIAAAPELLDALKAMKNYYETLDPRGGELQLLFDAEQAIAKAEGRK